VASHFLSRHESRDVSSLVRSNIEFTAQLAEAAALLKVPAIINTGTSWQHYQNEPFSPVNLYAATKQAAADILRFYAEAAALRVITLELFDTYGPADPRPKLFSALRQAAKSPTPLAMSPGDQLIDLVYIDDVIDAYLVAAERIRTAGSNGVETFAACSGTPKSLRDVAELWSSVSGRPLNVQWSARPHRSREMLAPWSGGDLLPNWEPRTSLEEGIRLMEAQREGP